MAVEPELRIVDAHHHLWDLKGPVHYPWLVHEEPFFLGSYDQLRRNYMPDDYRRDAQGHNVVATVHVEAESDRSRQVDETEWLSGVAARWGMPNAIVAHAWIDEPNSEEILAGHCKFPLVRGIRSKPVTASRPDESVRGRKRTMQHPDWLRGFALFEKYGLSWDLRVPWWHLEEAAEVARQFPNTRIVLNHTGFPWDRSVEGMAGWRKGMRALALCPNVHCKISCLLLRGGEPWSYEENRPIVLETIATFGVERCMFASNFPVDGLRASWDHIYTSFKRAIAHLPRGDQQRMLADNAIAFYRIAAPAG